MVYVQCMFYVTLKSRLGDLAIVYVHTSSTFQHLPRTRRIDPQVQEWPVELQLPTREIGPCPEPEVYPCRFLVNDGQWTEEEHAAHLHKAARAVNLRAWNREAREEAERHNREYARGMAEWQDRVQAMDLQTRPSVPQGPPPKGVSSMRALPNVHEALRQNDPSKAPASQPILPKKAPPTTGRSRPSVFYSGDEPPRIGSAPGQPPPPLKQSFTWKVQTSRHFPSTDSYFNDSRLSTSSTYRSTS